MLGVIGACGPNRAASTGDPSVEEPNAGNVSGL